MDGIQVKAANFNAAKVNAAKVNAAKVVAARSSQGDCKVKLVMVMSTGDLGVLGQVVQMNATGWLPLKCPLIVVR